MNKASTPPGIPRQGSDDRLAAENRSTSADYRRNLAFWKEVLHNAPALAPIPGRRRVPAPVGMGCNRGPVGIIGQSFDLTTRRGSAFVREALMAAYARTLAERFGLEGLIIDNWSSQRSPTRVGTLFGPFDCFYPIVLPIIETRKDRLSDQLRRADCLGHSHRGLDTPSIETELQVLLRLRNIALRQFGFAFIDAELTQAFSVFDSPLDAIAVALHEIQFAAAADTTCLQLRLACDLDVVPEEQIRRIFDTIVEELGTICPGAAPVVGVTWQVRTDSKPASAKPHVRDTSTGPGKPPANLEREIPVTSTQKAQLHIQDILDSRQSTLSAFVIGNEFVVRPQLDVDRLERVIDKLAQRHEVLRTRFFKKASGEYGAYLERDPSRHLHVETVSDEAEARQRAAVLANEGMDHLGPLFQTSLLRFGNEGDLIVTKVHHLVMDGYSLGLVIEDLFKAYLGLPLPPAEMDIERFVREFDHIGKPESYARRDTYLRALFADPPPVPDIGRKAKGLRPNVELAEPAVRADLLRVLPSAGRDSLRKRASVAGTSETAMVTAALVQTIADRGKVDDIILHVTSAMRHSRHLEYYANCVAADVPIRARLTEHPTLEALAVSISEALETGIQLAPFLDALVRGELHDEIIAKGSYHSLFSVGNVTVNKWTEGTTSAPLQRPGAEGTLNLGMFTIEPLPSLRQQHPSFMELELRSFPTDGGLGLFLSYDTWGYNAAEAEGILDDIVLRLERH